MMIRLDETGSVYTSEAQVCFFLRFNNVSISESRRGI